MYHSVNVRNQMKTILFFSSLSGLLISFYACCALKICESEEYPSVLLRLSVNDRTGFSPKQVKDLQILVVNKTNHSVVDSFFYFSSDLNLLKISCRPKREISEAVVIDCLTLVDTSLFRIDTSYQQPVVALTKEVLNAKLRQPIEDLKAYDYLLVIPEANFTTGLLISNIIYKQII